MKFTKRQDGRIKAGLPLEKYESICTIAKRRCCQTLKKSKKRKTKKRKEKLKN